MEMSGQVEVELGSGVHLNIVYGKDRACEPRERVDHGRMDLVVPQHVESSQSRDHTHVSCIGSRILYH